MTFYCVVTSTSLLARQAAAPLASQLSSVSLGALVAPTSNGRGKRIRILTPAQREAIKNLTDSNQIPHTERKRHWNAFYRRLEQKDLPEGLLQKWQNTSTDRGKWETHFNFIQCFFSNHDYAVFWPICLSKCAKVRIPQELPDRSHNAVHGNRGIPC